eukprot:TRINITY_DN2898_c0_g1_i1.p1 TRINITY_DN2898_c0_g1~~TRINITY_DN2898_c0_g1_i1.p1  ORF type:complete len:273 (-),score=76.81 TRINITY_DN2898_c0_g1_i1:96-914(-)
MDSSEFNAEYDSFLLFLCEPVLHDRTVDRVIVGVGYTMVEVSGGLYGLCGSVTEEMSGSGCTLVTRAGTLGGSNALELMKDMLALTGLARCVGIAIANSVLNARERHSISEDRKGEALALAAGSNVETVCMVGFFAPVFRALEKKKVWVFDSSRKMKPEELSFGEALETADCCIITSTSLMNRTFGEIAMHLRKRIERRAAKGLVLLMGPSTPMSTELFRHLNVPVDYLCGSIPKEGMVDDVRKVVMEGGGTKKFIRFLHKLDIPMLKPAEN